MKCDPLFVFPNLDALCRDAARRFIEIVNDASTKDRPVSVALSGGATPRRLYEILAEGPTCSQIPWEKIHFFWGDERLVAQSRQENNFKNAQDVLFSRVPAPANQVHAIPVDPVDPESAAARYEETLRNFFAAMDGVGPSFDLVLLGLGEDGHVASLFPGSPALREAGRWVVATEGGNPSLPRISLTLPVLNGARNLLWLVAGSKKSAILRRAREEDGDLPAQLVAPLSGAVWLVDSEAASLLA